MVVGVKLVVVYIRVLLVLNYPNMLLDIVGAFNLYFTLYGASELWIGGALANPRDMLI